MFGGRQEHDEPPWFAWRQRTESFAPREELYEGDFDDCVVELAQHVERSRPHQDRSNIVERIMGHRGGRRGSFVHVAAWNWKYGVERRPDRR